MSPFKSLFLLTIILLSSLFGCDTNKKEDQSASPRIKNLSQIEQPRNGARMTVGDTIQFKISTNDPAIKIDSASISTNGKALPHGALSWNTSLESPGKKNLLVSVFLSNGTVEKKRHSVTLFSDIEPVAYTYRIINTYVHDPDAFTQGLLIDQGQLYESTGEKGHSTIRKIDLKSGKVTQSANLSSQYFGEGIGLMNDKIYMLSWKARTGFIFDKNSLEQTGQFAYATEGWGMTAKDDTLLMSDGSHRIRFMDPASFTELRQIEVYDQTGPIDFLNELEYINGDLFAIRWQTNSIYIIDPASGKVKGILDLTGIFDFANYGRRIDVLNGIAYDKDSDKYYITGKWWPKLFEIQLIAANNI